MSVNIHYKGQINDKKKIYAFISEIKDIAETMNWEYDCLDEDWQRKSDIQLEHRSDGSTHITGHAGLKGISFSPHVESDTVWLFFDQNGQINSPFNLVLQHKYGSTKDLDWLSIKTHCAGVDTHITLIKLFRYLKSKYIHNLEIKDDGNYWETNMREQLEKKIEYFNTAKYMLSNAFSNLTEKPNHKTESLVRKIEGLLRDLGFEQKPE